LADINRFRDSNAL